MYKTKSPYCIILSLSFQGQRTFLRGHLGHAILQPKKAKKKRKEKSGSFYTALASILSSSLISE
uniref:Uncharacterized protein n=1 Tax=Oryza brachyantha TaxID=4533 RepID=J3LJ99_ORYBR